MRTTRLVALGVLAVLTWATPGLAQISKSPLMTTFPGWGVQAWEQYGWLQDWSELAAEAFHFSPDGSFYDVLDEDTVLKIAVTFDVKQAITKHKIPIDAGGCVVITLDGTQFPLICGEHKVVEVDLSSGRHTLVMTNSSGNESENWAVMVVGKCLWGTDKNIAFVKAGLPDPQ